MNKVVVEDAATMTALTAYFYGEECGRTPRMVGTPGDEWVCRVIVTDDGGLALRWWHGGSCTPAVPPIMWDEIYPDTDDFFRCPSAVPSDVRDKVIVAISEAMKEVGMEEPEVSRDVVFVFP